LSLSFLNDHAKRKVVSFHYERFWLGLWLWLWLWLWLGLGLWLSASRCKRC
jgi:hypothetical protein